MLTDNHVVILAINMIWIIKREEIKHFKEQGDNIETALNTKEFTVKKFKTIFLDQMFGGFSCLEFGLKIHSVNFDDLAIMCNA